MRVMKPLPSQQYLQEIFDYDPDAGELRWKWRTDAPAAWNGRWAGKRAGRDAKFGYIIVAINQSPFKAHRIIWKLVTGVDPHEDIDHEDLNRANNRWGNLREASCSRNKANMRAHVDNRAGIKGVTRARGGRYRAQINAGRVQHLGTFDTPEEANEAYRRAAGVMKRRLDRQSWRSSDQTS